MSTIESVLDPPLRDLGDGFRVRRALPAANRRAVGPFVFFDQMGPATFQPGKGLDVRPHPHIGLATVTYLFDGAILHRDSLGTVEEIRPSELNWMVAGAGIAHSERTPPQVRASGATLAGIQCWIGLPQAREEMPASFQHYSAATLPVLDSDGVTLRLIAGSLFGQRSPVQTLSEMFYADVAVRAGGRLTLTAEYPERAVYVVQGQIEIDGQRIDAGRMAILRDAQTATLRADDATRLMLLGGAPLDGPRHLWWNFVSSSKERIEQAKADWRDRRFGRVPGDDEFIPLPTEPPIVRPPNYP